MFATFRIRDYAKRGAPDELTAGTVKASRKSSTAVRLRKVVFMEYSLHSRQGGHQPHRTRLQIRKVNTIGPPAQKPPQAPQIEECIVQLLSHARRLKTQAPLADMPL